MACTTKPYTHNTNAHTLGAGVGVDLLDAVVDPVQRHVEARAEDVLVVRGEQAGALLMMFLKGEDGWVRGD